MVLERLCHAFKHFNGRLNCFNGIGSNNKIVPQPECQQTVKFLRMWQILHSLSIAGRFLYYNALVCRLYTGRHNFTFHLYGKTKKIGVDGICNILVLACTWDKDVFALFISFELQNTKILFTDLGFFWPSHKQRTILPSTGSMLLFYRVSF